MVSLCQGQGLHLLTPVLNINCLLCSLLFLRFFQRLYWSQAISSWKGRLVWVHHQSEVWEFLLVCPDFVFLFFRYRARLVVVLFPPFAYGTGTYVGMFSAPLCVFSVGLAGFLLFRLLFGFYQGFATLSPSLLGLLTEFREFSS